jgi:hypothetical protein
MPARLEQLVDVVVVVVVVMEFGIPERTRRLTPDSIPVENAF